MTNRKNILPKKQILLCHKNFAEIYFPHFFIARTILIILSDQFHLFQKFFVRIIQRDF